jgi:N6-adenosine-specific RNA methylase IME4
MIYTELAAIPRNHYRVIYADFPWHWRPWKEAAPDAPLNRNATKHYKTLSHEDLCALPIADIAAKDCILLMWATWPMLPRALECIEAYGFTYKTAGFDWMKANGMQMDMFDDSIKADMKLGFWTRSNTEPCLLATRGKPKRNDAGVRMGIIEPARQHSRKPDCVYGRIERLADGPYLEMFARNARKGWDSYGNEVGKFQDHSNSI